MSRNEAVSLASLQGRAKSIASTQRQAEHKREIRAKEELLIEVALSWFNAEALLAPGLYDVDAEEESHLHAVASACEALVLARKGRRGLGGAR